MLWIFTALPLSGSRGGAPGRFPCGGKEVGSVTEAKLGEGSQWESGGVVDTQLRCLESARCRQTGPDVLSLPSGFPGLEDLGAPTGQVAAGLVTAEPIGAGAPRVCGSRANAGSGRSPNPTPR